MDRLLLFGGGLGSSCHWNRLVSKSGSTTLTLDKGTGQATLERKVVIWRLKPAEALLSEISDVTADMALERASGVESGIRCWCSVPDKVGHFRLKTSRKLGNVTTIRKFLSLS